MGYGLLGGGQFEFDQSLKGLDSAAQQETERNIQNKAIAQQAKAARAELGTTVGSLGGAAAGTAIGAGSGAESGAAAGSVVPGWGTAIGALVGAVAGYFGSKLF